MKRSQLAWRLIIVALILAAGNFYVGFSYLSFSPWAADHSSVFWLGLGGFFMLQLVAFVVQILYRSREESPSLSALQWVGYAAFGAFACLFFFTVCADVMSEVATLVFHADLSSYVERDIFWTISALTLGTVLIGMLQVAAGPRIIEVDIEIDKLQSPFDGFRIAQISDLHVSPMLGRRYTERVVEAVNGLSPDLIAMTGDFADGPVSKLRESISPLANLRSTHGKFFVTGNHEYYCGADAWIDEHRRLGARVLLNEHEVISKGSASLVVAGVTDLSSKHFFPEHESDPIKAVQGAPESAVKLLLAHQPATYRTSAGAGYDLQLSGHTHGGQFFPWKYIVGIFHQYFIGLGRHGKMWIYVNRGTGFWGPPLRTAVRAEITLLTLRKPKSIS